MRHPFPKVTSLLIVSSGFILPPVFAQALPSTKAPVSEEAALENHQEYDEKLTEIRSYDIHALSEKFNQELWEMDARLQAIESNKNLTDKDRVSVSRVLKSLGDICWPKNSKTKPLPLDGEKRFEQAKNFKLRSLNLIDSLGNKDLAVKEHRELMRWFRERQCVKEEANEFLALAKILKSVDPEVIDPSGLPILLALSKPTQISDSIESRKAEEAKQVLLRKLPNGLSTVMALDKNSKKFQDEEESLSRILKQLEVLNNLTIEEEFMVGRTLNRLANLHCPLPEKQRKMFRRENDFPKVSTPSDQLNFERGSEFKKREFQLHNRLHADITNQIRNRRALMYWYADRGHQSESDEQIKILSKILGTDDQSIINPPRLSACGQIIEDDGNAPGANRATFIGCGMG